MAGSSYDVLILGGGQLARMLADRATAAGVTLSVLAKDAAEPAAQVVREPILGDEKNVATLREAFSRAKVVTFENEFIDVELMRRASEGTAVRFAPSLDIMARLQDKLQQKQLLSTLSIATAPWDEVAPLSLLEAKGRWPQGIVLKWAKLGYDGKGTLILPSTKEQGNSLSRLSREQDLKARFDTFWQGAQQRGVRVFAEELIPFEREVAMVAVRSAAGEFSHYPLVISEQQHGMCVRVRGPAVRLGVPVAFETQAADALRKIADHLSYVGILACEFFVTPDGRMLVNEIAPRVHNTGHYTMDACLVSQFENHLRAVSGHAIVKPDCTPFFAMHNLIGPEGVTRSDGQQMAWTPSHSLMFHWYGKGEIKSGRKMGHLNLVASSVNELRAQEQVMDKAAAEWATFVLS